jgi:hypothetical protein
MAHHGGRRKNFKPVKRPGAATRKAHKAGESVGTWAKDNYHAPGLKGEQARFAVIAKKWHHRGGHRKGRRGSSRGARR